MVVRFSADIDRIKLLQKVDKMTYINLRGLVIGLCVENKWKWHSVSKDEKSIQSLTAYFMLDASHLATVRVFVVKCMKIRYLMYDFKPRDLCAVDINKLLNITEALGVASYRQVLQKGRVSYLEVAVDVVGKRSFDYIYAKEPLNNPSNLA